MVFKHTILLVSTFAIAAFAAPAPQAKAAAITAAQIKAIAPTTANCPTPAGQCADADRAAKALNSAFDKYRIDNANEQAALVAYVLFESLNFKYNHNLVNAGQGTRMMAMPIFVAKYATAAVGADAVKAAGSNIESILALVNKTDELSFGAAAWFYSTQCSAAVKTGVQAGNINGWHNFIQGCIGTLNTDARDVPYNAALKVIK